MKTSENDELLSCLSLFDRTVEIEDFVRTEFAIESRSPELLQRAHETRERCHSLGSAILHPNHEAYPESFFHLESPPAFLNVIGSYPWLDHPCISIVGSREARPESIEWMDLHLSSLLRKHSKLTIVSGGARGIDRNAHLNSIRAGTPTVIFLPSGLGMPYPEDIREFFAPTIAAGGCVVSPFAPMQEIRRMSFEARNRLIAAMSSVLFVVEGRRKSGSLMTARLAIELGRTVCVLPGFPSDMKRAGVVDLLVNGAFAIRDDLDLSILLGPYL
jgi:DNA processing protein